MFNIKSLFLKNEKKRKQMVSKDSTSFYVNTNLDLENIRLSKDISENVSLFKTIFSDNDTLIIRTFSNFSDPKVKCAIVFLDGMIKNDLIDESIVFPILRATELSFNQVLYQTIKESILFTNDVKDLTNIKEMVDAVSYGDTLLLVDHFDSGLIITSKGWGSRSIGEPKVEGGTLGSHEAFTEAFLSNISLVRRRIASSDFKVKYLKIGRKTNTRVGIGYVDGIVNQRILKEVENRLRAIDIDGILDSNYLQELIGDAKFSVFKTLGNTERPDVASARLLEGRIAIFVDGSPSVITVPYLFMEYFQANDDYFMNFYYGSFARILRAVGFVATISLPALYLAYSSFHPEAIPIKFLMNLSLQQQEVPFPKFFEILLLLFLFDILKEASAHMPQNIGQALSIVGGIIIGQAAVEAGLVTTPMIILTALTAITGLMSTEMMIPTTFIRLSLLLLTYFIGIYGYALGIAGMLLYLSSIVNFDIPYLQGTIGEDLEDSKDGLIRSPWSFMKKRPSYLTTNVTRQRTGGDRSEH